MHFGLQSPPILSPLLKNRSVALARAVGGVLVDRNIPAIIDLYITTVPAAIDLYLTTAIGRCEIAIHMQSDAAQTEDTTLHVSFIIGSAPFVKLLKHILTAINHSELQVENSRWQCSTCKIVEARPFLQVLHDQLSQVAAVPIAIDHVEVLSP